MKMRLTLFVCKLMKYAGPAGLQIFLWPMPIKIWRARKNFSEASGAEGPVAMEDFVVPPDCIAELLQELQSEYDIDIYFQAIPSSRRVSLKEAAKLFEEHS